MAAPARSGTAFSGMNYPLRAVFPHGDWTVLWISCGKLSENPCNHLILNENDSCA